MNILPHAVCMAVGIGPTQGKTAQVSGGMVIFSKPGGISAPGLYGSAMLYLNSGGVKSWHMPNQPLTTAPWPSAWKFFQKVGISCCDVDSLNVFVIAKTSNVGFSSIR